MKTIGMVVVAVVVTGCAGASHPGASSAANESSPAAPGETDPGEVPGREAAVAEGAAECHHPEPVGPVVVPEATYASRTGHDAVRFSQLNTSAERPLEECGLRTVLQRLATLTCDDGSNPFKGNLREAHASRAGNIGPGGRCGSILDQYDVPCREKTYAVHADMYLCSERNVSSWLE